MIAILGAGGPVADELTQILNSRGERVRAVSRSARTTPGAAQNTRADLADASQTRDAVAGSRLAFLLAGVRYDCNEWAAQWPRIMENSIGACKQTGARLVFFDNVYMYGKVSGPMTEETPFNPCSRKGEVRARIAMRLIEEWKSGALTAMIARSADFYGPGASNGVPNVLVFGPLAKGKPASWLGSDSVPHSLTWTRDAAQGMADLAARESAWNQTWHLPTAPHPLTGRQVISLAAKAFGVKPRHRVLRRPLLRIAGVFNPLVRESYEMLYQNEAPYIFDSGKYAREFGFTGTTYEIGIQKTAQSLTGSLY